MREEANTPDLRASFTISETSLDVRDSVSPL